MLCCLQLCERKRRSGLIASKIVATGWLDRLQAAIKAGAVLPAVAIFRMSWLNDRLASAHTAALVLDAAPSGMVPESLAKQILDSVGDRAVAMKMGDQRRLLASSEMPWTTSS